MSQRLTLCAPFILIEALVFGQGFNHRYDAFGWDFAQDGYGIEITSDGYMVISSSADCDSISPDECFFHASVLLTKIDVDGAVIWEKRAWRPMHSAFAGWANCCDTIPGGGYIVGGASEATDGSDEVYLMRFDANGDTLWTRVFGDPTLNRFWIGYQVKRAPNGDFIIVGFTDQLTQRWGFAIRTDENGEELWTEIYPWSGFQSSGLISSVVDPDGDLFMGGTLNITNTNDEHWLQRTNADGEVLWRTSWGGPDDEGATQIIQLADGHILVFSARGYAADGEASRHYQAKIDSADGSIIWDREYGEIAYSTGLFAGKETPTGDLIACGVTYAEQGQKGLLLRTNSQGDSLWMRSYYYQDEVISNGQGRFYDVLPTPDGGFIAAGAVYNPIQAPNPPGYSQDTWVVKVDAEGCIVPGCNGVGITEQATNLLGALTIFPNPVAQGGSVTVQLDLPPSVDSSPLQYTVVTADGRVVLQEQLPSGISPSPSERVGVRAFSLSHLSSGLYYIHISTGSKWLTGGKLIVE